MKFDSFSNYICRISKIASFPFGMLNKVSIGNR